MANKKILIMMDQEGCESVTRSQNSLTRVQLMCAQAKKIIGFFSMDDDITIVDCHDNGLSLLSLQTQYPHISVVPQIWNFDFYKHYDYAVLAGFHAARGMGSPFAHTFREEIVETVLGDERVGEVTLIVKFLNSINIPVLWVQGEKELKEEVNKLHVLYYEHIDSFSLDRLVYKDLPIYSDVIPVRIKLIHDKFLDAFPSQIFNFDGSYICFKNIRDYLLNLSNVSIFLNAARNYFLMYFKGLCNRIKWKYNREDIMAKQDEKLNGILNKTNTLCITVSELEYLEKIIE